MADEETEPHDLTPIPDLDLPAGFTLFGRPVNGKVVGPFVLVGPDGVVGEFDSISEALSAAADVNQYRPV